MTEANAASKLTHKNIAQVFEVGVVGATCFVAMELVEGPNLKEIGERAAATERPLSPAHVARIVADVADALHHIHTRRHRDQALNLLHRDVSPTNILVSYTGDVKLTDFGVARAKQRLTQTQAGLVRGKCEYASPEQVAGQAVDGRSDLFSLGVVMWELLAGRRLFAAATDYETLRNVLQIDVPSLRGVNPAVPEELDRIAMKLLDRNIDQRTSSAGELQLELDRFCKAHPPADGELPLAEHLQELFGDDIRELLRQQTEEREAYAAYLAAGSPAPAAEVASDGDDLDADWDEPAPDRTLELRRDEEPSPEPPAAEDDDLDEPDPEPPALAEPPADMEPEETEATQSRAGVWLAVVVLGGIAAALIYYYIQIV